MADFWQREHLVAELLVQLLQLLVGLLLALAQDTAHHVAALLWRPLTEHTNTKSERRSTLKLFTKSAWEKCIFHHSHQSNPSLMVSAGRAVYSNITPGDCAVQSPHCISTKLPSREERKRFDLNFWRRTFTHTLKRRPAGSHKTHTARSHTQQLTVTRLGSLSHSAPRDTNTKKHILGFTWNQFVRISSQVI